MANIVWVCDGSYIGTYMNITVPLVSATAKTVNVPVLLDEVWLVTAGYISNGDSVARDVHVYHYDASGNFLDGLVYKAALAAATREFFPNNEVAAGAGTGTHFAAFPIPMSALSYLEFYWSAGVAGAGGNASIMFRYKKLN